MKNYSNHKLPELSQAIDELFDVLGRRNFSDLGKKTGINRHMLRKIVEEGADVALKLSQLGKLNDYLLQHGIKLLALPTFMEKMARQARTICLLPSYKNPKNEEHSTSSPWDVLSMTYVRDAMTQHQRQGTFKLNYIDGSETHIEELTGNEPLNLVLIGSPRAYKIADEILCRMFFEEETADPARLPFRFFWGGKPLYESGSPFQLSRKELKDLAHFDPGEWDEFKKNNARAFVCQGKVYPIVKTKSVDGNHIEYKSYGVVVAQKRGPQFWLCVSGLDGPATKAVGIQLLKGLPEFVIPSSEAVSPVIWLAIECVVTSPGDDKHRGETREIKAAADGDAIRLLTGPQFWQPSAMKTTKPA